QLTALYELAVQCPTDAGTAVFRARTLYDNQSQQWNNWQELAACTPDAILSIETPAVDTGFSVFPNPANDHIHVQLDTEPSAPVEFKMHDFSGRIVLHQQLRTAHTTLDLQHLPNGLYTISLWSETKGWLSEKVVVRH
ncbi:MAG: T9SS type A sorting domain-containing protein, partial [Bacteroidota bacterium]